MEGGVSREVEAEWKADRCAGMPVQGTNSPVPALEETHPRSLLVRIRPSQGWPGLRLHELWAHRELLFFLAWRDVKVRYKQTGLGVAWALIQPLAGMIVFTVLFSGLAGISAGGAPYAAFAYAGLVPWTFFASAVTASGTSLVSSANLLTKVYFPRAIIPAAAIAATVVDLAISLSFMSVLLPCTAVSVTWKVMLLPLMTVLLVLLALAVGLFTAALNVKYRDVRHAMPFLLQVLMFCTPVVYPPDLVPQHWRWLQALNPLTGIIDGFRACLLGGEVDGPALATAGVVTLGLLTYSVYVFGKLERQFADIV